MKAQTKTLLYVLGGAATLIGGATAIYFATRDEKKTVTLAPPAPVIPVSTPGQSTPQAELLQQQNQNQPPPPPPKPPPPQIQLLQNLSQII